LWPDKLWCDTPVTCTRIAQFAGGDSKASDYACNLIRQEQERDDKIALMHALLLRRGPVAKETPRWPSFALEL